MNFELNSLIQAYNDPRFILLREHQLLIQMVGESPHFIYALKYVF